MNLRRALIAGLTAGTFALTIGHASAQTTTTFAQFKQQTPNSKPFAYSSNSFHLSPTPQDVFFNYGVANQYDNVVNGSIFGGNIKAKLTLTSTKSGNTSVQGSFLSQNLSAVTMVFALDPTSITAAQFAALGNKTNLLTITGTSMLSGPSGSAIPSMSADTNTGFTVNYTSDFINFPATIVGKNYNLSFSGATPALGLNGSQQLRNFVASGTGTFDYSTVPEGNSLLFLAFGLAPAAAAFAYRRRKASVAC